MQMAKLSLKTAASAGMPGTLDALFGTGIAKETGEVTDVPLDKIDQHPKQSRWSMNEDELNWLASNIEQVGILEPVHLMPKSEGRYLLLAGHRRCEAAKRVKMEKVPAIIHPYNEQRADIIFNATNLGQRQELRPSEKAFAYTDLEKACADGRKSSSAIAELTGDNVRAIQRYKRLTLLHELLLQHVDCKDIPVFAGEALSYLSNEEQAALCNLLGAKERWKVSLAQAQALKDASAEAEGDLNEDDIKNILCPQTANAKQIKVSISEFANYFPAGMDSANMIESIRAVLDEYMKTHQTMPYMSREIEDG